jgi:hypothetical protein
MYVFLAQYTSILPMSSFIDRAPLVSIEAVQDHRSGYVGRKSTNTVPTFLSILSRSAFLIHNALKRYLNGRGHVALYQMYATYVSWVSLYDKCVSTDPSEPLTSTSSLPHNAYGICMCSVCCVPRHRTNEVLQYGGCAAFTTSTRLQSTTIFQGCVEFD